MSLTPVQAEDIRRSATAMVESAISIASDLCTIPAPTGAEERRAARVAGLLQERGYATEIDDLHNVFAFRGPRTDSTLMLLAHTDTVFPDGTALATVRDGNHVFGPAIGDNCLGVAAMLTAIDVLDQLDIATESGIRIVANVGEEGLGNLRGAWRAVERFQNETGAVIAIEGHNLGRITHMAVGSRRLRITVNGPGGHSWGAFGQPSAIHGLGRIIAAISSLKVPEEPRTTYNVGLIEGGTSINTIAPVASALVDMRSVDAHELDRLSARVGEIIDNEAGDGLDVEVEILGERPAGAVDTSDPYIRIATETLRWLDMEPVFDASSTDANVPISLGIPAFCIGITRGGRVHTIHEYIDVEPVGLGLAQLTRLCVDATAHMSRATN